jgi:hypothetical protein
MTTEMARPDTPSTTSCDDKWVTDGEGLSSRVGGRLLVHCFIVMFLGFIGGFVWLIQLAEGAFHILPLPKFNVDVPDESELLRNAHTGPIMNSTYVMVMVLLSQRLKFSARQGKWFYWAAVVTLWGNTIGYSAAVYAPERGLQPTAGFANLVSYGTFYAAVVGATITTAICLKNAIAVSKGQA